LPNPFADGEMTLWFHPVCAAYKRPEPLLETLSDASNTIENREDLERIARSSIAHKRLPRIDGAEPSPSSQAKCRHCRNPIERDSWRVRLVYFEEGMFSGGGFIHLECRNDYFETDDVADRVLHFSSELDIAQLERLKSAFASGPKT